MDYNHSSNSTFNLDDNIEQLFKFVKNNQQGCLCIHGQTGLGKSTLIDMFLTQLCSDDDLTDLAVIKHTITRASTQTKIENLISNCLRQIDIILPKSIVNSANENYKNEQPCLISKWQLWSKNCSNKKLLVVIDNLDDLQLLNYLPLNNAINILIVLSCKYEKCFEILNELSSFTSESISKIELKGLSKEIIRKTLNETAQLNNLKFTNEWIDKFITASQGNPLYLKLFCNFASRGSILINEIDSMPNGLLNYYNFINNYYKHHSDNSILSKCLLTLAVAKDYLTINQIKIINGINDNKIPQLYHLLDALCDKKFLEEDIIGYQLFNNSFRDYILQEWESSLSQVNKKFIDYCSTWQTLSSQLEQSYTLSYYAHHLYESEDNEHKVDLINLLHNTNYINKQINILRHYNATTELYRLILQLSSEINDYETHIKSAQLLLDLRIEELSNISQIFLLISELQIELALIRIKSLSGPDIESLKRMITIYFLSMVKIAFKSNLNKDIRKEAMCKILSHFDSQIPVSNCTDAGKWDFFLPCNMVFMIACECAALNLDYMILYKRASRSYQIDEHYVESIVFLTDIQFEILKRITKKSFFRSILIKHKNIKELKILAQSAIVNPLFSEKEKSIYLSNLAIDLASNSMLEDAFEIVKLIADVTCSDRALKAISVEFAKQCMIDKAFECAQAIKDNYTMSLTHVINSAQYQSVGLCEMAEKYLDYALDAVRQINKEPKKVISLKSISHELNLQGRKGKAVSVLDEALSIGRQINNKRDKADILRSISSELFLQGKQTEAVTVLNEAINYFCSYLESEYSLNNSYDDSMDNFIEEEIYSMEKEDDDDDDTMSSRDNNRIISLRDALGEDYYEKALNYNDINLFNRLNKELVIHGEFLKAWKLILAYGKVEDKIRMSLNLATELVENNQIEEADELIKRYVCDDLFNFVNLDNKHWIRKTITLWYIEQDRLSEAKIEMEETLLHSDTDEKGNDLTWWCFDEFIDALEKKGYILTAVDWIDSIYDNFIKDEFLAKIALKLIKSGLKNETVDTVLKMESKENNYIITLSFISYELFVQEKIGDSLLLMKKALNSYLMLNNDKSNKSEVEKRLLASMIIQNSESEIIEFLNKSIVSDHYHRSKFESLVNKLRSKELSINMFKETIIRNYQ